MKEVRVTPGQASNLDPAGALTSPYSDQVDVQAAVHRNDTLGWKQIPEL
jgi:hypothetical protein